MTLFSRRRFLQALGGLSLPAWFPRLAFGSTPARLGAGRDVLVCVFQRGGADGLNVVVPFGDGAYYANRPQLGIREPSPSAGTALDLDGFFGLHPALAPLKELYDQKWLAPVHAVGSPDGTHSHFQAQDYMERGTPGSTAIGTGWIARHLASLGAADPSAGKPFRAVGIGSLLQASLRGPVPATALRSIAEFHLRGSGAELQAFQTTISSIYSDGSWLDAPGQQTLDAISTLGAANLQTYQPRNGAKYPTSGFGLAMQQVAQLIRADLGLEVACVDLGGWDTHHAQGGATGQLSALLADFASGLHAFATDMADQLGRVTIVTMSEFGRRVQENASGGTDHGHGNCMFVLGGGVNGGKVYSSWPGLAPGQLASPGDLAVTTDFRTVLAEIVDRRLRNAGNLTQVFPNFPPPAYLGILQPSS
jgi:uncharacterized protein (DUF1501 family)